MHRFFCYFLILDPPSGQNNAAKSPTSKKLDALEEQMRSLLISTAVASTTSRIPSYSRPFEGIPDASSKGKKRVQKGPHPKRDACTAAVLREAGVSGYQINKQAEAELQVALANAEYFAKQATSTFGDSVNADREIPGFDFADEEIDMAEIEEAQGYVKK